jgi:ketosteroid isomerase-like protein
MRRTLIAALSLLLVGAWSQPAQAQVPDELADLIPSWAEAFNAGDAAAVASHYTEDAIRMPPEGEFQRGSEAIAADIANYAGVSIELRAFGGMVDGKSGSQWGAFKLTGTAEDGTAVEFRGRWMNALKKTADGWKIYRDIWNYGPSGEMPPAPGN